MSNEHVRELEEDLKSIDGVSGVKVENKDGNEFMFHVVVERRDNLNSVKEHINENFGFYNAGTYTVEDSKLQPKPVVIKCLAVVN